nr:hypothetical protein [Tanacetum cinerariifolium]
MIFDGMLRNLDNVSSKFLMYPRFIQTFFDKQLDGLPTYKEKYDVSFHTKKVFANMKRNNKEFSCKETPLSSIMVGPNQVQIGGDSLVRATTTASSLEAKQDSGNIDKTQTKATSNEPSSQGTSSGDGPRRQDTMGVTSAHTRYARISKMSSVSLLAGINTSRSDEDKLKHIELMKIYTTLQKKVLDLEDELKRTKTAQQTNIDGLERRVKKLKKKQRSRTHKLKRLYKVGLTARVINSSDDEALDKEDASKQGRIIDDLDVDEYITLMNDQEMFNADKDLQGEEVVVEQEVVVDKEPIVDAAQAEEQQELNEEEKARLFMELLEKRRKFFAAKRTEEKRNRPPTKAQQRSLMCTYLKNMDE